MQRPEGILQLVASRMSSKLRSVRTVFHKQFRKLYCTWVSFAEASRCVILPGILKIYLIFPHSLVLLELIMPTHLRLQASLPVLSTGNNIIGASAQLLRSACFLKFIPTLLLLQLKNQTTNKPKSQTNNYNNNRKKTNKNSVLNLEYIYFLEQKCLKFSVDFFSCQHKMTKGVTQSWPRIIFIGTKSPSPM